MLCDSYEIKHVLHFLVLCVRQELLMRIGGWTCSGQSSLASKMRGREGLGMRLLGVASFPGLPRQAIKNWSRGRPGNEANKELVQMVLGKLAMMLGWRIAGLDSRLGYSGIHALWMNRFQSPPWTTN